MFKKKFVVILKLLSHTIYRLSLVINAELLIKANTCGFLSSSLSSTFTHGVITFIGMTT